MMRSMFVLAVGLELAGAAHAQEFKLTSPDIKPRGIIAEEQVFNGFSCTGKNVSPALTWSGAPKEAKSFALLVYDPDAPAGGAGWWHWLVIDIPGNANQLKKDAGKADGTNLPAGAGQISTDFGAPGWGGPCPPAGDKPHRYNSTLHALKVAKLDIPKGASASLAGFRVNANSIAKASLTGRYARKR